MLLSKIWMLIACALAANVFGQKSITVSPLSSINAALKSANPGDEVVLAPGVYHEQVVVTKSGLVQNPITLRAQNPLTAILDGSTFVGPVLDGSQSSHVSVDGLEIRNCHQSDFWQGAVSPGNSWALSNLLVHHSDSFGVLLNLVNDVSLTNVVSKWHVAAGFHVQYSNRLDVLNCESSFNGYHGITQPQFPTTGVNPQIGGTANYLTIGASKYWCAQDYALGCVSGGGKWLTNGNVTLDGYHAHHNFGPGIYLDWENTGYVIRNSLLHNNVDNSIIVEASRSTLIHGNSMADGIDLALSTSHDVTFSGNTGLGTVNADNENRDGGAWIIVSNGNTVSQNTFQQPLSVVNTGWDPASPVSFADSISITANSAGDIPWTLLNAMRQPIEDYNVIQCGRWRDMFQVQPGNSWGNMPSSLMGEWVAASCDSHVTTTATEAAMGPLSNTHVETCTVLMLSYDIVPGVTWGNALPGVQNFWGSLGCDTLLNSVSTGVGTGTRCVQLQNEFSIVVGKSWGFAGNSVKTEWGALGCDQVLASPTLYAGSDMVPDFTYCLALQTVFGVIPGNSWGEATPVIQNHWGIYACDVAFPHANFYRCQVLKKQFGIVKGVSWGNATSTNVHGAWVSMACDTLV